MTQRTMLLKVSSFTGFHKYATMPRSHSLFMSVMQELCLFYKRAITMFKGTLWQDVISYGLGPTYHELMGFLNVTINNLHP